MLFSKIGSKLPKQGIMKVAVRHSSFPSTLYNNVWRKSNVLYITYIATGCVVFGGLYGSIFSTVWNSANSGVRAVNCDAIN